MSDTIKVTPAELDELLDFCIPQGDPVYVWGPPGIGKSEIIMTALARHFETTRQFFALLHDPTDVRGFGIPDRERGVMTFLRPEFFSGNSPIGFFVDELSNAPMLVKNALLQLTLDPDAYLPQGSYVVAAGNRASDKTGSSALPSALANRFTHVELVASVDDWSRWAMNCGDIAPVTIAYARFQPDAIEGTPNLADRAYCTPRALAKVGRMLKVGIPAPIETPAICGTIGDTHGTQLAEFVRTWRQMPSLDAIIDSPESAVVPKDRGVVFALIHGLALKAKPETFDSIVAYALRLSPEFTTALVSDCVSRDQTLTATSAYVQYATKLEHAA